MKWIILAGGSGTRLYPLTRGVSKQLMSIYDKPMVYYPLSVLMMVGIREVLIITTPEDQDAFKRLLWDGSQFGIALTYAVQPSPDGLAQAFLIGAEFVGSDDVCLILWDNLFYGHWLDILLQNAVSTVTRDRQSVVFGYEVNDPARYWVVEFDAQMRAISIEEKPEHPKSHFAVVGLYFYTNDVLQVAQTIRPSARGELEITAVNDFYLQQGRLQVQIMNRWYAWLDTGTHESMLDASNFIQIIEARQGIKIGCLEEIAFRQWWISPDQLRLLAEPMLKNSYGRYLLKILGA